MHSLRREIAELRAETEDSREHVLRMRIERGESLSHATMQAALLSKASVTDVARGFEDLKVCDVT